MRRMMAVWVMVVSVAACGSKKTDAANMPASGTMMAGDSMAMMAAPMLPKVRLHLDSLASSSAAMHDAAMAGHAAVMGGLLQAMQTDLMHMGMHSDSAYEALADSVVKDQVAIAAAPAAQQAELVRQHLDRVRRLMAVYDGMVGKGRRG
jgi:hypothetical protein